MFQGEAPYELSEFDPLRYGEWTSVDYAVAKTRESYGSQYWIIMQRADVVNCQE